MSYLVYRKNAKKSNFSEHQNENKGLSLYEELVQKYFENQNGDRDSIQLNDDSKEIKK